MWICFDRDLVEQVAASESATRPDPPPKDHAEHRLVVDASVMHRIKFARRFKYHQRQLGFLANTLDFAMDMFDDFSKSPTIDDIARQALLQVDHPYQLCAPQIGHHGLFEFAEATTLEPEPNASFWGGSREGILLSESDGNSVGSR